MLSISSLVTKRLFRLILFPNSASRSTSVESMISVIAPLMRGLTGCILLARWRKTSSHWGLHCATLQRSGITLSSSSIYVSFSTCTQTVFAVPQPCLSVIQTMPSSKVLPHSRLPRDRAVRILTTGPQCHWHIDLSTTLLGQVSPRVQLYCTPHAAQDLSAEPDLPATTRRGGRCHPSRPWHTHVLLPYAGRRTLPSCRHSGDPLQKGVVKSNRGELPVHLRLGASTWLELFVTATLWRRRQQNQIKFRQSRDQ